MRPCLIPQVSPKKSEWFGGLLKHSLKAKPAYSYLRHGCFACPTHVVVSFVRLLTSRITPECNDWPTTIGSNAFVFFNFPEHTHTHTRNRRLDRKKANNRKGTAAQQLAWDSKLLFHDPTRTNWALSWYFLEFCTSTALQSLHLCVGSPLQVLCHELSVPRSGARDMTWRRVRWPIGAEVVRSRSVAYAEVRVSVVRHSVRMSLGKPFIGGAPLIQNNNRTCLIVVDRCIGFNARGPNEFDFINIPTAFKFDHLIRFAKVPRFWFLVVDPHPKSTNDQRQFL